MTDSTPEPASTPTGEQAERVAHVRFLIGDQSVDPAGEFPVPEALDRVAVAIDEFYRPAPAEPTGEREDVRATIDAEIEAVMLLLLHIDADPVAVKRQAGDALETLVEDAREVGRREERETLSRELETFREEEARMEAEG